MYLVIPTAHLEAIIKVIDDTLAQTQDDSIQIKYGVRPQVLIDIDKGLKTAVRKAIEGGIL